ncbi:MAG: leucine-rich repeat domain-containing protein, partial [Bacteroidaceae bacterium]|nr:leucine-rich repeat domain-containing protein [Bacteroidaceae bacterium]
MKHYYIKSMLTALLLLCCTIVSAQDFEVGGFYYDITNATAKTVMVYGDNDKSGNVVIPDKVTYGGTTYKVTSIAEAAFAGCEEITSVTIPNSVTSIGEFAFNLCTGLTSITIPGSVTSIGEFAFNQCISLTAVHISDLAAWCKINFSGQASNPLSHAHNLYLVGAKVTNLVIPSGITDIKKYAFEGCSGLTSVTIPGSVTSIGRGAFSGCNSLTAVHISDLAAWYKINFSDVDSNPLSHAHNLYLNGEKVTNLVIPNGVTGISSYAFYGCSGLTSVTIPNSVTSIGTEAFYECNGLTAVHISDLAAWCKVEAYDPFSYGHNLYLNGEKVTDLVIPYGVTRIGFGAFDNCRGLTRVTIPSSVTSIGSYAFSGCSGLTGVTIPNSVTSIGQCAFSGCGSLRIVAIGRSVTSIGERAFEGCSGLKTVYNCSSLNIVKGLYDNGYVAYYANEVLAGFIVEDFLFRRISGVSTLVNYFGAETNINLPYYGEDYVIGSYVFENNTTISSVTIPGRVTSIGSGAFARCSGLTSVTIGNSVTSIGNIAFNGCTNLTSVTIGNSVTSIGSSAFNGCSGLTSVTIPNSVTSIDSDAFNNCTGLTAVHISDLAAWCRIDFSNYYSNPLSHAHNLYLNGEKVTDLVIPSAITDIKQY